MDPPPSLEETVLVQQEEKEGGGGLGGEDLQSRISGGENYHQGGSDDGIRGRGGGIIKIRTASWSQMATDNQLSLPALLPRVGMTSYFLGGKEEGYWSIQLGQKPMRPKKPEMIYHREGREGVITLTFTATIIKIIIGIPDC